jgi:hypothetical protein
MRYFRRLVRRITDDAGGTGTFDRSTMAFRATPWVERETGSGHALYTGRDGSVWLYAVVRNHPLYYEDDAAILDAGRRVENVLHEVGKTSLSRAFGMRSTASYRDIHVLSVRWEGTPEVPPGTPTPAQESYLSDVLEGLHVPQQATFLGIKLRDLDAMAAARSRSMLDMTVELVASLLGDKPTDFDAFEPDRRHLQAILRRHDCRAPTTAERRRLEAWFNDGRHA